MQFIRFVLIHSGVLALALLAGCGGGGTTTLNNPAAPTISGAVSGLTTGASVVLDAMGQSITISSNGAFSFPATLASGSVYTVTIGTQPAGQNCGVAGGSGTVGAADNPSIVITCTAETFTIGGSVAGLASGESVVLDDNGGDALTIATSGTFTFTTALHSGSAYAVTVRTQPTGQTCSVAGGSGTVNSANIANVVVTCSDQAFTLGGTIQGLNAAGLVLADGTNTLTVASGATSFTLPAAVAYTSPYSLVVQSSPADTTCTIVNGSGVMGAAAVTNITVTCVPETFTVGGSISGLTIGGLVLANGTDTLSVVANATAFTMPTGVADGATYNVTVRTNPVGLSCLVTGGTGTVAGANVTNISISCASSTVSFTNGQAASVVIGQNAFTTSDSGTSATTLDGPWGGVSLSQGIIYITDYGNSRILGYDSIPTQNGAAADFVIGQTNLNSGSVGTTASTLDYPWANSIDGSVMVVSDTSNNRVLLFSPVPTSTGASASVVVGQNTMTAYVGGCTASTFDHPAAAIAAAGKLVVADYNNSRILIWNTIPSSNGAAADVVVGQSDMTTCTANAGGVSASSLNYPGDVWTDGTKLIVADSGNNRVLVWNTFPTSNDAPADIVIGQSSFSASAANQGGSPTASTIWSSAEYWSSVTSNGSQIFVSDYDNNRVLIFNTIPTTNGAAADIVLGQPNFTSNTAADPPTASSLNGVGGVSIHGNQFFLTDYGNNRVLIYDSQ